MMAGKKAKPGGGCASAVERKRRFAEEFLSNGRNALQAAISVGYSQKTAGSQGSRLLKNVDVQQIIAFRTRELQNNLQISTERILLERARLAFFDPRKLFRNDGSPIPVQDLDDDTASAIAGLEVAEIYEGAGDDRVFVGYVKKYKLSDKTASLTALEKHLGMYEADNRQKNPLEDLSREVLQAMRERLAALANR